MESRSLVMIIYLSLVTIVIGLLGIVIKNTDLEIFVTVGSLVFLISGTYLVASNGEYIKTREYKLSGIGVSMIIVGVLFKIMHWPLAMEILFAGFVWFSLLYFIYMFRYKKLSAWNFLKLIFITSFLASRFLKMNHLQYSEELSIISLATLFIVVMIFIKVKKIGIIK